MRVDRYLTPARLVENLGKLTDSLEQVGPTLSLAELDELVQHNRRLERLALAQVESRERAIEKEAAIARATQVRRQAERQADAARAERERQGWHTIDR